MTHCDCDPCPDRLAIQRARGALSDAATVHTDNVEAGIRALTAERNHIQQEFMLQWQRNHDEHCQNEWPHIGECYWPLPTWATWRIS